MSLLRIVILLLILIAVVSLAPASRTTARALFRCLLFPPRKLTDLGSGVYSGITLRQLVSVSLEMYASEPRQVSAHSSSLLDKARALGLRLPLDLERLAMHEVAIITSVSCLPGSHPLAKLRFLMRNSRSRSSWRRVLPRRGKFDWRPRCSVQAACAPRRLPRWRWRELRACRAPHRKLRPSVRAR